MSHVVQMSVEVGIQYAYQVQCSTGVMEIWQVQWVQCSSSGMVTWQFSVSVSVGHDSGGSFLCVNTINNTPNNNVVIFLFVEKNHITVQYV